MTGAPSENDGSPGPGTSDLEEALTTLAWSDPAVTEDAGAALAKLGVEVPAGLRLDVRIQRSDTLYLVIPPEYSEDDDREPIVNQMDLWGSGDQFIWILPQDAKAALLQMRETYRNSRGEDGR